MQFHDWLSEALGLWQLATTGMFPDVVRGMVIVEWLRLIALYILSAVGAWLIGWGIIKECLENR